MFSLFNFKKESLIIFSIMIVLMISLGSVYAADSDDFSTDVSVDDGSSDSILSSSEDSNSVNSNDSDLVSNSGSDDGAAFKNLHHVVNEFADYYVLEGDSFESIQYAIDSVEENSTIVLHGMDSNRSPSNFYGNGSQIVINKSIILDGQGCTLDAKFLSRIFYITANNVTLTNLNLINANHRPYDIYNIFPSSGYPYEYYELGTIGDAGGVIKWLGDNGRLKNTVFSNNIYAGYPKENGRIISWEGKNGTIKYSYFGINYMVFDASLDGVRYISEIIDAPIYGDYEGDLYRNNVLIRNAIVNSDSKISLDNISRYFGSCDKVSLNLTDDDGFVFSNVDLSVNISNDKFSRVINCSSDSQGLVKFDAFDLPVGTYDLSVNFGEFSFNSTLTVEKAPIKFVSSSYKAAYDSGKKFSVKVVNSKDNSTVSGVKVSLKVYTGSSYKTLTATTNGNGVASFSLSKNTVGSHKIIITASGNVVSAKKTSSISITKSASNIKLAKSSFKYKKSDYLKMTITNKNTKKAISKLTVKVKVYTGKTYKTYSLKTDKNGIVKINTKSLKKGSHKIVISSSSKYYTVSRTAKIKVK